MKAVFLTLLCGLVGAAQETPAEIDPSKIPGEWRTIYAAADNKDKIVEGGPLRNYYRRIECIDDCESLSITFYLKDDGACLLLTEVAKRKEGYVYVIEVDGTNTLEVIHVSENMLVTYAENYDGERITKMTEGLAKGTSFTQEELQKYQQLNSEREVPNENIENVIETDKAPGKMCQGGEKDEAILDHSGDLWWIHEEVEGWVHLNGCEVRGKTE
ncbi:allergen Bos d 2-like [Ovis canadensis]|uniref:allergen Bos d 2-like n=1 Tax=Ovis canadensis TaxID=37174 RepID=UPI0038B65B0E